MSRIINWPYFIHHSIELTGGLTWDKDFPDIHIFRLHAYKNVPRPLMQTHWLWIKDHRITPPETGERTPISVYLYEAIRGPITGSLIRQCPIAKCVNPWHHEPSKRANYGRRPAPDPIYRSL